MFGSCEGAVVFSEKDERLDGIVQRARGLPPDFQCFINFERLVMVFDSTQVIVGGKQSVGLGAQRKGNLFFATQPARNEQSSFGKEQGLFGIDADFFPRFSLLCPPHINSLFTKKISWRLIPLRKRS